MITTGRTVVSWKKCKPKRKKKRKAQKLILNRIIKITSEGVDDAFQLVKDWDDICKQIQNALRDFDDGKSN